MSLKSFVKVGSITNLSDARYCAGMGVDFLGFVLDPKSPEFVDNQKFSDISEWVSGVTFIGEFNGTDLDEIQSIAKQHNIEIVQVYHSELIAPLKAAGYQVIMEVDPSDIAEMKIFPDYSILTSNSVPTGNQLDLIRSVNNKTLVLLATALDKTNVEMLLENTQAHGIALRGSAEIRPGYKDYDQLADILEELDNG